MRNTSPPASPPGGKYRVASILAAPLLLLLVIPPSDGADLPDDELRGSLPERVLRQYSFPFDEKYREEWQTFYCTSSEWDTINTLVKTGTGIAPSILEAIKSRDMYLRRYAIIALGYIPYRDAIDSLSGMIHDESEIDYFHADALQSLFRIDEERGRREAEALVKMYPQQDQERHSVTVARRILENPSTIEKTWSKSPSAGGITIPNW